MIHVAANGMNLSPTLQSILALCTSGIKVETEEASSSTNHRDLVVDDSQLRFNQLAGHPYFSTDQSHYFDIPSLMSEFESLFGVDVDIGGGGGAMKDLM